MSKILKHLPIAPFYLGLLLTMLLPTCQVYPSLAQRLAMSTSVIEETNITPTIAATNKVIFSGLVTVQGTDEPVLFGSVAIYQNEHLVAGTETDFDGRFHFQLAQINDTLTYRLQFSYLGMYPIESEDIKLAKRDSSHLVVKLGQDEDMEKYSGPFCPSWQVPLIEQDNTTSGQIFTSDQIRRSPTRGR